MDALDVARQRRRAFDHVNSTGEIRKADPATRQAYNDLMLELKGFANGD